MIDVLWGGSKLSPELHAAAVAFVDSEIGNGLGFGNCKTMSVFEDGDLLGAAVFHNWEPQAGVIEISAAATDRRWLSRPVLQSMFAYPFESVGCQMVVMRVSPFNTNGHNRGICRMLEAFGFTKFVIPRLRGRHEDGLIFTLTDDAWRSGRFYRG
jgi:RimJ/RimL family protein N-acetyltransferase